MPMEYIRVPEEGILPPERRSGLQGVLAKIIPAANPDFDPLYPHVREWLIEIEPATGLATREIGFDAGGAPIVAAPFPMEQGFPRNYGMHTDNPPGHPPFEDWRVFGRVDAADFERAWTDFTSRWKPKR